MKGAAVRAINQWLSNPDPECAISCDGKMEAIMATEKVHEWTKGQGANWA